MAVPGRTINVDQTGNSPDDIARAYRAHGVVAVRNYFSADVIGELANDADMLYVKLQDGEIDPARVAYRPTVDGGKIFERFDPVCDISPAARKIAHAESFRELAARLVGGEPILFKDKLVYKLNGDRGYGLHQDHPYYDFDESLEGRVATMAVAIDEISDKDGGLQFYLGCHDRVQPAPAGEPRDVDAEALAGRPVWHANVPPGSLIAFDTLTPHGSGPNRSQRMRRVLYLTYMQQQSQDWRSAYYAKRGGA
jgi:ectoine hydroxylase-related dioxygenase (phytanoyl-CoA dioxygenase family)